MKCPKCKIDLIEKQVKQSSQDYSDYYSYFRCKKCYSFEYSIYNPMNNKKCGNIYIRYIIRFKDKLIESVKYNNDMTDFTELSQQLHCCTAKIVTINQFSDPENYEDVKSYEKILDRLLKLVVFS